MPQSQYYKQNWNNHLYFLLSQWEYNSPESSGQPPYQHSASYTSLQDHSIEEKSDFDKILKVVERRLKKMEDSRSHQNFQIQVYTQFVKSHHNKKNLWT